MNFPQLVTKVRRAAFEAEIVSTETIRDVTNDEIADLTSEGAWPDMLEGPIALTLGIGQTTALPDGSDPSKPEFSRMKGIVRLAQDTVPAGKLRALTNEDFLSKIGGDGVALTGAPRHYTIMGNKIHVWPRPTTPAPVELYYYRAAKPLTAADVPMGIVANDVLDIPQRFHALVELGVVRRLNTLIFDQDDDASQAAQVILDKRYEAMKEDRLREILDKDKERIYGDPSSLGVLVGDAKNLANSRVGDSTIIGLVNDVQRDMLSDFPYSFMERTDQVVYENGVAVLPEALTRINAVKYKGEDLELVEHFTETDKIYTDQEWAPWLGGPRGPWAYALNDRELRLIPAIEGDTTLQVTYTVMAPELTAMSQETPIPADHLRTLVLGVAAQLCLMDPDPKVAIQRAGDLTQRYEAGKRRLMEARGERTDGPRHFVQTRLD